MAYDGQVLVKALAAVMAIGLLAGCGGERTVDRSQVGRWVLDRDGSDRRATAAELELFGDGRYRLTVTVDGKSRLLENQWEMQDGAMLLRFAAENTGDERRINAHGVEVLSPGRLQLLYRVQVGEVVRVALVRSSAPAPGDRAP